MIQKNKKKKSGLRTLILSLVLAVVLWIVIGIIQDPDVRGTITNIPVEYTGAGTLSERGLVVTPSSGHAEISVNITGKRRDLIESSKSVGLVIDVSNITEPGKYMLDGTVISTSSRITVERERVNTIPVVIEELVTEEFPITLLQSNVPKGILIETKLSETKVKVSGAQSEIDKLEEITAELDAANLISDAQTEITLRPKLKGSAQLPKETTISLSFGKVTAKNTVYAKKTLPVKMRLSQKLSSEYWLDTDASSCAVSTAEIGVLPTCTADCVYLNINTADSEDGTYMLLSEEGMYIPEKDAEIHANPVLVKKQQRHMDITLTAVNVPSGLTPEFNPSLTGVLVSAPEEVLNEGNITGVLDLTGLTAGVHSVTVKMENEKVTLFEEITVNVTLE
ncbi:MAG: CdaR family protein [bacterium]|nr:CdaR family protein [bacterium]